MATTTTPAAAPKTPGASGAGARSLSPEERRALIEAQTDPRGRLMRLIAAVLTLVVLAYGWRVTEIDLGKLITNLPAAQHIVRGLLNPDVRTLEVTTKELATPFRVGPGPETPSEQRLPGGETLRITPGAVQGGQEVTFEGSGFAPNSKGPLSLEFSAARGRKISDVETDANGNFDLTFDWPPNIAEGDYAVTLAMNTPTGRWLPSEALVLSASKMVETVLLALMGTAFGIMISIPLSFFGAHNLMQGSIPGQIAYYVVRTIFNVGRSIEIMILAVIMAVVVGIGPFAGVMAIVLHSIGAMGKLYSEALESIDPGPIEAVTATGASRFQAILYAVVPQVIPQFLAFTMYRWDTNVRMSTVIGLVGGGGIGFLLIQYINLLQWSQAATAIWLIAIVVMAMDYASAYVRARLV